MTTKCSHGWDPVTRKGYSWKNCENLNIVKKNFKRREGARKGKRRRRRKGRRERKGERF